MKVLEDLEKSLLNFGFIMIYTIHRNLVMIKITWIISKIIFSNAFLSSIIDLDFF